MRKSAFALSVALAMGLLSSPCFATLDAATVQIRIGRNVGTGVPPKGDARGNIGLIYGAENSIYGDIEFLSPSGSVIDSYPVVIRFRSVGATAIIGILPGNWTMSLMNTNGKTVSQLFGTYYGLRLGLGVAAQVQASLLMNSTRVFLGNAAGGIGVGFDAAVPAVTLYSETGRDVSERIRIRTH